MSEYFNAINGIGNGYSYGIPESGITPGYPYTVADYPPDTYTGPSHGQPKQQGFSLFRAASNFIKGGVVDTIKGIFSLKGLATMALAGGAIALTGGAAIPYLVAAGIGLGGLQVAKGTLSAVSKYASGDTQGAENAFRDIGSGVVSTALSIFGARAAYKNGIVNTGIKNPAGKGTLSAKKAMGSAGGLFASVKATVKQVFADVTGKSRVLGKRGGLGKETLWQSLKTNSAANFAQSKAYITGKYQGYQSGNITVKNAVLDPLQAQYQTTRSALSSTEGRTGLFNNLKSYAAKQNATGRPAILADMADNGGNGDMAEAYRWN